MALKLVGNFSSMSYHTLFREYLSAMCSRPEPLSNFATFTTPLLKKKKLSLHKFTLYKSENQMITTKHPHFLSTATPPSPTLSLAPTPTRSSLNLLVLAESHYDDYELITSKNLFNEHLSLFPHSRARIHFNIASIHLLLSSPQEALSSLRTATSIDPYLVVAQYQLGALFLHFGDLGPARKAYQMCRDTMCNAAVDYEQVGMRFVLWPEMVTRGLEACEGVVGRLGSVPAGVIFRVCDRKARVRNMGVRRGSWAFGGEGKVLAAGKPENVADRGVLDVEHGWNVEKDSGGKEAREGAEVEVEVGVGKKGKATDVLRWFKRK